MEIKVTGQKFELTVDGEARYEMSYQETMGRLVGLRYKFLGLGEVVDFMLTDQDGNIRSSSNFNVTEITNCPQCYYTKTVLVLSGILC